MTTWVAVIGASVMAYLVKLAGYLVPKHVLERPKVAAAAAAFPIALLCALLGLQTLTRNGHIGLDARVPALAVAVIALRMKAPFIVAVASAAATAATLRALGWMA